MYSSRPSGPPSRPVPDIFTPPNGAEASEITPAFAPSRPNSRDSDSRSTRSWSPVKTYDARPYSVSFAMATASSSVRKVWTGATGPKISSRTTRASAGTSARTVGRT